VKRQGAVYGAEWSGARDDSLVYRRSSHDNDLIANAGCARVRFLPTYLDSRNVNFHPSVIADLAAER